MHQTLLGKISKWIGTPSVRLFCSFAKANVSCNFNLLCCYSVAGRRVNNFLGFMICQLLMPAQGSISNGKAVVEYVTTSYMPEISCWLDVEEQQ